MPGYITYYTGSEVNPITYPQTINNVPSPLLLSFYNVNLGVADSTFSLNSTPGWINYIGDSPLPCIVIFSFVLQAYTNATDLIYHWITRNGSLNMNPDGQNTIIVNPNQAYAPTSYIMPTMVSDTLLLQPGDIIQLAGQTSSLYGGRVWNYQNVCCQLYGIS